MDNSVILIVESEILPGKLDALKGVISRVVAHTRETEPNTLMYSWYINEAETELRVVERYTNSDAVLFHGQNYADFAKELADLRKVKKMTVCGAVSEQLKQALSNVGAEFHSHIDGHFGAA